MIARPRHLATVLGLLRDYPVVALLGPRQVGKTTLARQIARSARGPVHLFDLEDPRTLARIHEPMLELEPLRGLVVIDEIQRWPELFPALRVLADRPRRPARFLVLGSASPALLKQTSESLAGRISYHDLDGLSLSEVGGGALDRLWVRGGYPRAFTARTSALSETWRVNLVRNLVERELPQLGFQVPGPTWRRFLNMLAHYHGQTWNASEFGRSLGVADTTVRRYLDALTAAFIVLQLQPWHENLGKRQVKAPRIYLRDSGLLHLLLGVGSLDTLRGHPRVGASWEGFALQQVVHHLGARPDQCYFWRAHTGAELDLLVVSGRRRLGFEFKRTEVPTVTPSMRTALADLRLDSLDVVHAGADTFMMSNDVRAVALRRLLEDVRPL